MPLSRSHYHQAYHARVYTCMGCSARLYMTNKGLPRSAEQFYLTKKTIFFRNICLLRKYENIEYLVLSSWLIHIILRSQTFWYQTPLCRSYSSRNHSIFSFSSYLWLGWLWIMRGSDFYFSKNTVQTMLTESTNFFAEISDLQNLLFDTKLHFIHPIFREKSILFPFLIFEITPKAS